MAVVQVYFESTLSDCQGSFSFDLLRTSRKNNLQNGITGILLFNGRSIEETLEGDRDVVHARFDRIRSDSRHEVSNCCEQTIPKRMFSKWSVGSYRAFGAKHLSAQGGLLDVYFFDGPDHLISQPTSQRSVEARLLAF